MSASAPVNPGEVVAPEDHDTWRDCVIMLEPGEEVVPEVHNTGRDGVVAPEEDHDTLHDGVSLYCPFRTQLATLFKNGAARYR